MAPELSLCCGSDKAGMRHCCRTRIYGEKVTGLIPVFNVYNRGGGVQRDVYSQPEHTGPRFRPDRIRIGEQQHEGTDTKRKSERWFQPPAGGAGAGGN